MLHMIDWKAELARLEAENTEDCRGPAPAGVPGINLALTGQTDDPARVHLALTEPSLDDQLLRMYVERELANLMGE